MPASRHRHTIEIRTVRTKVTLPACLKNTAEAAGLTDSQALQTALAKFLGTPL